MSGVDLTSEGQKRNENTPQAAMEAVLIKAEKLPEGTPHVKGVEFNNKPDLHAMLQSFRTTGFQATALSKAVEEVEKMIRWRLSDEPVKEGEDEHLKDPAVRANTRCTIFLGFTSNMISSGTREVIRYLCEHKMIDCIVTTGGGIEEDLMKCFEPHYMGDFHLNGKELRKKGQNRIGNLLVPNDNYCVFEDWMGPILDQMYEEQKQDGMIWSPRTMIRRFGKEIDNAESVLYWCYKNDIPVFCPAITDGSIGDMIYFQSFRREGFIVDIAQDIRAINDVALNAQKSGMLILGGGLVKHHICNANLMRNGADFSVFVNTAMDYDGSDAGARPDEAISWGKIKLDARPVKVYGEATIMFPLIVADSFVRLHQLASRTSTKAE